MEEGSNSLGDWHHMIEALPQVIIGQVKRRSALLRFQQRRSGHGHGLGLGRGNKCHQQRIASLVASLRLRKRRQCCKRCHHLVKANKRYKRLVKRLRRAHNRRWELTNLQSMM